MINSEELLFCVDENNNPIEPKPRSIVHSTGIWHRVCNIWIINNKNEILCQKRSLLKDNDPGLWNSFVGGHQAQNINAEEQSIIELKEELGLNINSFELRKLFIYKLNEAKEFISVFILKWNGDINKLKLEPDEIDEVKWFSVKDFKKQIKENMENWSVMGYESKFFELV